MKYSDIVVVLNQLDSDNDAHWTIDGSPRIDVLCDLGLTAVTREMVTEIAPLFSRSNRELPDIEGQRAELDRLNKEAAELEAKTKEAKSARDYASRAVAQNERVVKDSHNLTRQNQQWIESQNKLQADRMAQQRTLNDIVKQAGGLGQIGLHPLEVNERARIKAKRRNFVLPAAKKA